MKQLFCLILAASIAITASAQKKNTKAAPVKDEKKDEVPLSGIKFRNIGPALTSGRISDFAVNPANISEYYVATSSGGVWKTLNAGTTYEPIFDSQGSYSIGCIILDPNNPNVVWVGSGENNNQRSVAYGDGVYRSEDGGTSWKNMGLKTSEHIGSIVVDPRNSSVVYVAAIGPLWKEGGERGVYKTTDGGKTWTQVLKIDDHTGVNEIVMDPRNADVLYASAFQRRRHDYAYVSGGPGSGVYKTVDGGKTWEKANTGLPKADMGRIGLAISSANPEYIYAIVEAAKDAGFYRSTNRGASWQKMSTHQTGGNYYNEVVADPRDPNTVYTMGYAVSISNDGGKNFKPIGEKSKHVDNHALWVNPANTNHMINGCDGGIYETWDGAKTWQYKANLPVTQFYKVEVDNTEPFYYVYGGTQDNFSLGGPSRTRNESGILNSDWFVTNGGDGFESAIDPYNPNIVYAQSQHGGIVRFDKATGESIGIQPKPRKGENEYRWNWDAPLQTSAHKRGRIYFAANKVFRSDDYGNTWQVISEDASRNLDRNKLPLMGKVWSIDASGKNDGTAPFGTVSALSESPKNENLIIIGTDDGLIHVTADGGKTWKKTDGVAGVPTMTYVYHVFASQHDENVMYATLNNHKRGDFKPYLFKSSDKGTTWTSITANLPERGSTYSIAEDHVDPMLLFAATEFGVHFSNDGGKSWRQLKGGLPTIGIRDMAIQKRENDLVLASFGRGFYVLDDYSPLRNLKQTEAKEGYLFPIKNSQMYIENSPLGIRGKGFMGESLYAAENPKVGAAISYFYKEDLKTRKEKRQEEQDKLNKDGKDVFYPNLESMKEEEKEENPYLLFTIRNDKGDIIRKLKAGAKKGVNRIVWDFRYPSSNPINISPSTNDNPFQSNDVGQLAAPGNYTVTLSKYVDGVITDLAGPEKMVVNVLPGTTMPAASRPALVEWQRKAAELQRSMQGASRSLSDANNRVKHLKEAIFSVAKPNQDFVKDALAVEDKLRGVQMKMNGDRVAGQLDIDTPPSISSRLYGAIYDGYGTTSDPTTTMKDQLQLAAEEFEVALSELKAIVTTDLRALEQKLEAAGAPYTPGRLPDYKKN
ncbi:MAG: glycosyl hydrolase [Cytophagales bacterium]|nr:glycosyl hydrolase [Cytophagales bacterium]